MSTLSAIRQLPRQAADSEAVTALQKSDVIPPLEASATPGPSIISNFSFLFKDILEVTYC